MFVCYMLLLLKTLVSRLTPDQGDKYHHAHDEDDTIPLSEEEQVGSKQIGYGWAPGHLDGCVAGVGWLVVGA